MRNVREVKGTIVLTDGTESEFTIGTDGGWQQWGATRERLGRTVDALEAMVSGLLQEELLPSDAEDDEEQDEGTVVVDTRPVCEVCDLPLSRDETTDSLNRGRLLCWDHDERGRL